MSEVTINSSALNRLLHSSTGPVGLYVERKVVAVTRRAQVNARAAGFRPPFFRGNHPATPFMRTGDLANQLRAFGPFASPQGAFWHVGSDAKHGGVPYPAQIEKGGVSRGGVPYRYPYLEPALPPDFTKA